MIDETTLKALQRTNPTPKNFPDLGELAWHNDDRSIFGANADARGLAQNLIEKLDSHAHLREARILLLMTTGAKPDADGMVSMGKPRKPTPLLKMFSQAAIDPDSVNEAAAMSAIKAADFIVEINGEAWPDLSLIRRLALLDHELSHCGVTIAGKWLAERKVAGFVEQCKADLVSVGETPDDKNRLLVRYRKRDDHGRPAWRIRKHEIEEFSAVIDRWGADSIGGANFFDVLERDAAQMPLPFSEPGSEATAELTDEATISLNGGKTMTLGHFLKACTTADKAMTLVKTFGREGALRILRARGMGKLAEIVAKTSETDGEAA